jgi:uncharacterized 2Fe-2S/4Fe-4S cluster protein (DUF4445 family)
LTSYSVSFLLGDSQDPLTVQVPAGTLLDEAARLAGISVFEPCGGQGRCGRCAVQVLSGSVHRRSVLRLSPEDVTQGYALSCQSGVESDLKVLVPPQEKIQRRLTSDRVAVDVLPPPGFTPSLKRLQLNLQPPSLENQVDDWSRLKTAFKQQTGRELQASLALLTQLGPTLREGNWSVTVLFDIGFSNPGEGPAQLVALLPGFGSSGQPLWGAAIDIGTTTVTVWLVNLINGAVQTSVAEYNGQIARGEDVISRIIYASRDAACQAEMQTLVLKTINSLLIQVCDQAEINPKDIYKAAVAGNSTMLHLFTGIPAASIRLSPFITAINHFPRFSARETGLAIHPEAVVDCLPGVASYVGSDISAGVLACELDQAENPSLFIDIGTNGETVLGCRDWLVTCACSAGPAFEGAGVEHGMRAAEGAIEEIWINAATYEAAYRTIGGLPARGLCGSGLIALLGELFLTGVIDKAGRFNTSLGTPRLRTGEHGPEYVVAWGDATAHGRDIVFSNVDIDNLLRTKAAIYAGFDVLAAQVGFSLDRVDQVLIGGSFGRYINIEKAIQIGLLPDMPWDHFQFLGNTAVRGAYLALVDQPSRFRLDEIAAKMTYIELSADNSFYNAFMSAMFLPHTDLQRFPSVADQLEKNKEIP